MATTVQNIVDGVSQDIRKLLANSGADANILMDYTNRISLDILNRSEWPWMKSAPIFFVTRKGVPSYFFGSSGAPTTAHNIGYALTDVRYIDPHSIRDRSNSATLPVIKTHPFGSTFFDSAINIRQGRPQAALYDADVNANLLTIYPAPDNQNVVQVVPTSPVTSTSVAGALSGRFYSIRTTFVDSSGGEGTPSLSTRQWVPTNSVLVVNSPPLPFPGASVALSGAGVTITQWRAYVSQTEGSETLQATTNISTAWTEPGTGLVAGAGLPTTSTLEPSRGYIIEFRYFKSFTQLTALGNNLQIPDDYKDVVIAGVNSLACAYLKTAEDGSFWRSSYEQGVRRMISDKNTFSFDYLRPA